MAKFKTSEEVRKFREHLVDKYKGVVPDYIHEHLDEEGERLKTRETIVEIYKTPLPEKIKYLKRNEKEFWEQNDFELVKVKKRHPNPVFDDFKENEDVVCNEEDLSIEERRLLISMCENDLYLFAVRYFSHYLRKPSSKFHKYLYKYIKRIFGNRNLDRRKRGVKHAIAAPRASAKSSLISTILPLWCICYNKKKFIIIISDTVGQASDFLADIKREIDFNVLLHVDFPHIVGKGVTWKIEEIITNNDIKVLALGTGSKIRGRRFGIYRPDLLLFDDLESSDMVRSPSQRDFIRYEWFNKDALHVGGEEGTCTDMLVLGTVLGKDSLLNALLDPSEYPDWSSKKFSAVIEFSQSDLWDEWFEIYKNRLDEDREKSAIKFFKDNKEEMLESTEVLWPEGESYYDLMVLKYSDPSAFETEKMNNAEDSSKILVTMDQLHFKDFRANQDSLRMLRDRNNYWYGALDPSLGKKSKKRDYSCILTIVRDRKTGYILVVDIDLKRRSVDKQIEVVLKKHMKYKYKRFGIETNAFQLVVSDNVKKIARQEGIIIPIKEILNYQDKKMRFEGVIPSIIDGTVVFDSYKYKYNASYRRGVEQITTFTGDGDKFDDAVDALTMAVQIAVIKRFKRRTKQTKR